MPANLIVRFTCFVAVLFFSIAADQAGAQTLTPAEEAEQARVLEQSEAKSRLAIYGWVETQLYRQLRQPGG